MSVLLSLLTSFHLIAAPAIFDQEMTKLELAPYMEILPENGRELRLEEIKQGKYNTEFKPYAAYKVPDQPGTYWIRFSLENPTSELQQLYLVTSLFDYITFYVPGASRLWDIQQGGNRFPNKKKEVLAGAFSAATLSLQPYQTTTCYMKVSYVEGTYFQFTSLQPCLMASPEFYMLFNAQHGYNLIFLGAMFIMGIYNLLLYVIVKDKSYLYYVSYNVFILLYVFGLSGYLSERFLPTAVYQQELVLLTGIGALVSYAFFAKSFLYIKKYYPFWNHVISFIIAALLAAAVLTVLDFKMLAIPVCFAAALAGYNIIFILAILISRKGYMPGTYFLIAASFYITAIAISIAQMLELLPPLIFDLTAGNVTQIGVVLELALFSLGLGSRINVIKKELVRQELEHARLEKEAEIEKKRLIEMQNIDLENKVQERTLELIEKNAEINQQKDEIEAQMENIEIQNKMLALKNQEIEFQNRKITDSIRYAKTIQEALLPSSVQIHPVLREHFVLFQPKDIVSGDFYWLGKQDNKVFVAVIDCTGHGVPGALMSIMGCYLFEDLINVKKINNPAQILEELHIAIRKSLKQEDNVNSDGMDIGLCMMERSTPETVKITYAGAKRPLLYMQQGKNQVYEIKGDSKTVGGRQKEERRTFTNHEIELSRGDLAFLCTDGLADQCNEQKEKYGTVRIKEFINQYGYLESLDEMRESLLRNLKEYQGTAEQRDDITIVGFRV